LRDTHGGVVNDTGAVDDGGPIGQNGEVAVFKAAALKLIDAPPDLANEQGGTARLSGRHRGRVQLESGPPKARASLVHDGRRPEVRSPAHEQTGHRPNVADDEIHPQSRAP
jgi:hypothetical protein